MRIGEQTRAKSNSVDRSSSHTRRRSRWDSTSAGGARWEDNSVALAVARWDYNKTDEGASRWVRSIDRSFEQRIHSTIRSLAVQSTTVGESRVIPVQVSTLDREDTRNTLNGQRWHERLKDIRRLGTNKASLGDELAIENQEADRRAAAIRSTWWADEIRDWGDGLTLAELDGADLDLDNDCGWVGCDVGW